MLTLNCLNNHMHKIGYSYTPLCEFCEDNDETDRDGTVPLETASHDILYSFTAALNIRADIYHERFTDENMIFNKNFKHNHRTANHFFHKNIILKQKA